MRPDHSEPNLLAHSLAEAYLFLMVTPCPTCGKGPLITSDATIVGPAAQLRLANIPARCRACDTPSGWKFQVLSPGGDDALNPSGEPSRLIDLAQWITLSGMITEAAGRSDDRIQARGFRIQASQCLDEALRFFDADCSLPPQAAFFAPGSSERFSRHPEHYERARVLQLRERLPSRSSKTDKDASARS